MPSKTFYISGMTCINCQNRIENALRSASGIEKASVNYKSGAAFVFWDESVITFDGIKSSIENLGYLVLENKKEKRAVKAIGMLLIIFALYILLSILGATAGISAFPLAESGMSYAMIFIIGIITSIHCAAMCGGINLSQCVPHSADALLRTEKENHKSRFKFCLPSLLYNGGRLLSYTLIGAIAGILGSSLSVSGRFQGVLQLIAGLFMIIMGINMLGLFPFLRSFNLRPPKIFTDKINRQNLGAKSPLIVGLLNGLMPCGPLQSMQIYALSTGSFIAGGLSMFLFGLGTIPLMFGLGALTSLLSGKFSRQVMKISAILITVMGLTMLRYGFALSGFNFYLIDKTIAAINPFAVNAPPSEALDFTPVIKDGKQIVNSVLMPGQYPSITVERGIPVKWIINAPQGSINGCNNRIIIREYGIEYRFKYGENIIEFMPEKSGRFSYSCWMGMIWSYINVIEKGEKVSETDLKSKLIPAGISISTKNIVLAKIQKDNSQTALINLYDDGIEPSIIVLKRNTTARLIIKNNSADIGNSRLIFPYYRVKLDMDRGENSVEIMPSEDFEFSTNDNLFYVYVKVVDDISKADIGAIRKEAERFETLIYPDAYFVSD